MRHFRDGFFSATAWPWALISFGSIVPTDYDPVSNPVGAGPYKLKSFIPGQRSLYSRFENYYKPGQLYADELEIIEFKDQVSRVAALRAGQIDVASGAQAEHSALLKADRRLTLNVSPSTSFTGFNLNLVKAPFQDQRVRQAFRLLADRQELVDRGLNGFGRIANDLYSPHDPTYNHSIGQRPYDLEQARSLLRQAGQPDLRVELTTTPGPGVNAALVFAHQAKKAGVEVKVIQVKPLLRELQAGQQVACIDPHQQPLQLRAQAALRPVEVAGERPALLEINGLNLAYDRQVLFDVSLHLAARQRERGLRHQIQYIFQNPYRALNPRHSVYQTLSAPLQHFFGIRGAQARERVAAVLKRVSLAASVADLYPHSLSGGERQRVAIARALVCEPKLLICDEITSALDVSVQASILALLRELQADGLTLLFVTHDLGVVRAITDRVLVLKHGRVLEQGSVDQVLDHPQAAYTRTLLENSPTLG